MMDVNERLIAKTFYFEYVLETYEAYVDYLMHLTCAGGGAFAVTFIPSIFSSL